MEGDKPLKMAWIKGMGIVFELLECEDKSTCDAAANCLNHLALRVKDMDEFVAHLSEKGIAIEAGPFDPPMEFDRPLADEDSDVFTVSGAAGTQLRDVYKRQGALAGFTTLAGCAPQASGQGGVQAATEGTPFENTVEWDAEYDVIVCGFGASGACAAIGAADNGAKVLLLEKGDATLRCV